MEYGGACLQSSFSGITYAVYARPPRFSNGNLGWMPELVEEAEVEQGVLADRALEELRPHEREAALLRNLLGDLDGPPLEVVELVRGPTLALLPLDGAVGMVFDLEPLFPQFGIATEAVALEADAAGSPDVVQVLPTCLPTRFSPPGRDWRGPGLFYASPAGRGGVGPTHHPPQSWTNLSTMSPVIQPPPQSDRLPLIANSTTCRNRWWPDRL